jgi:CHAT domain-containing protein/tetratricopeptide (TPR) repeat protein
MWRQGIRSSCNAGSGLLRAMILAVALANGGAPAHAQEPPIVPGAPACMERLGGKQATALERAQEQIESAKQKFGQTSGQYAIELFKLAQLYRQLACYSEAERDYARALQLFERLNAPPKLQGRLLLELGMTYQKMGALAKAKDNYQRAIEKISTMESGHEKQFQLAWAKNDLGMLQIEQVQYREAEDNLKGALAINVGQRGADDVETGKNHGNLGWLYIKWGRYADAELALTRGLEILERRLESNDSLLATIRNNLARLYHDQRRLDEALPLFKRALEIRKAVLHPGHEDVGQSYNNLAWLLQDQGQRDLEQGRRPEADAHFVEAEKYFKEAIEISEKALGSRHGSVGAYYNNLGVLYYNKGDYESAIPRFNHAIEIRGHAYGADHIDVAQSKHRLARVYQAQDRHGEAKALHNEARAIYHQRLGHDAEIDGIILIEDDLAKLYAGQLDWRRAAAHSRQASKIIQARANRGGATSHIGAEQGVRREITQGSRIFKRLVGALWQLNAQEAGTTVLRQPGKFPVQRASIRKCEALEDEAYCAAQAAMGSEAAAALAAMGARQAKGQGALADLVRERQDLVAQWETRHQLRLTALSRSPETDKGKQDSAENRARLATIHARVAEIDEQLKSKFPEYSTLARPEPLALAEVQGLLRADEALMLFLDTPEWRPAPEATFIWVVTKIATRWVRSDLGTKGLADHVKGLRCGLDHTRWLGDSERECQELLKTDYSRDDYDRYLNSHWKAGKSLPFDVARAHTLYRALFGGVEDLIRNKRLLIVPSGLLTTLPFSVLVTKPPKVSISGSSTEYRNVAWLGARQPITVLPSVSSLKALRQHAKTSQATKPYLGIGNPLLDGPQHDLRWREHWIRLAQAAKDKRCSIQAAPKQLVAWRASRAPQSSVLFRGPHADVNKVREWTPLPETADELCAVGNRLGAPTSDIYIGARATEANLKGLSEKGQLSRYRIVHFATHGALTGQVEGTVEPGLILTPPPGDTIDPKALELDDGFLTASEISAIKLDADWVILSACNTAAGTTQDESAEALSGLARAFFYAGARALLVSHWEVGSDAAVKLTTGAFAKLKSKPTIGHAGALRLSIRDMIKKGAPHEAHPESWAPFVVVGVGSEYR